MKTNINTILLVIIAILLLPISLFYITWFAETGYKLIPEEVLGVLFLLLIGLLFNLYYKRIMKKEKEKLESIENQNEM